MHNPIVRYLDFSKYHGKSPQGSTNLRVHQLIKHWPEADIYKYGEKMDVMIFQKVYPTPDFTWPEELDCIKILDLCDPDWLYGQTEVVRAINAVDAVTCSSQGLVDFISQLTDKPVVLVPDRFDLTIIPKPKQHKGKAKNLVWFGYAHNAETLKPAIPIIDELKLNLTVIADDNPIAYRWGSDDFKKRYNFVKHTESNIYTELQKADICILPKGTRPVDKFKSNNKTIRAILAGIPVADSIDALNTFMDGKERQKHIDTNYGKISEEYNVLRSVEQMKGLIDEISTIKNKA